MYLLNFRENARGEGILFFAGKLRHGIMAFSQRVCKLTGRAGGWFGTPCSLLFVLDTSHCCSTPDLVMLLIRTVLCLPERFGEQVNQGSLWSLSAHGCACSSRRRAAWVPRSQPACYLPASCPGSLAIPSPARAACGRGWLAAACPVPGSALTQKPCLDFCPSQQV